ncbi:MAG: internalization-related competence protein ComEC/Rec2 [Polaromonas sp.]|nr:internalization-related competence protein ComEC/Rec2 [Polaromonas sp.]
MDSSGSLPAGALYPATGHLPCLRAGSSAGVKLLAAWAGFTAGVAWQLQQPTLGMPWTDGAGAASTAGASLLAFSLLALAGLLVVRRQGSDLNTGPLTPLLRALVVALVFAGAVATGFGLTAARSQRFQQTALQPALEGKDIQVTGRVSAMPQVGEDGLRFRFEVESAQLDGRPVTLPPRLFLGWYSGFGARTGSRQSASAVPVAEAPDLGAADLPDYLPELQRQPQNLRAGERWSMTVRLKAPHGNSNPHGYDYELWLWEQGLQATGYVRAGPRDAPPVNIANSWAYPVERARQAAREAIADRVQDRQLAGVIAALVTGDQNAIDRADWDVFRATGVAHLMSISGLHITMFAWLASHLLAALWRRSASVTPRLCLAWPACKAGAWGGLLLAAAYALFSGWGVPAQRTVWMLGTVVLLRQGARQWPWPVVWLLAMLVVVVLDPWALMQAGFWLSFVAVGVLFATDSGADTHDTHWAQGIFHANSLIKRLLMPLLAMLQGLRRMAREQWVVTLALTPLSLLLFNQVSLVGLLANALAIPWVTLVVTPLAMLGVLWPPLWDVAAWGVGLLAVFLQGLARLPAASISLPAAPWGFAVAGIAGGALLAMRLPWTWRLLGLPLMLPVLLWQPLRPATGHFDVLGADVGQGNAVLVRTATHSLLYDSGPKFSRESDAGNRVLVPLLRALGERLDVLMLSHRDADHIGGAPAILAMQPQAQLISSIEDSHELQALRRSAGCVAGQKWRWDGVDFEVLHPAAADYAGGGKSNTLSCVLRISNGAQTALLAGDLEAAQEARLVADAQSVPKLRADFLLVPHHGSKTSSSAAFLDAVQPRHALAQSGYRNRFGHPAPSVMDRYRERSVQVVSSPSCGAASWRSESPQAISCQRQKAMRYWHHTAASNEVAQTAR